MNEYKCRTCGDPCDATPQCDQCRADGEAEWRGLQRGVEEMAACARETMDQRDALARAIRTFLADEHKWAPAVQALRDALREAGMEGCEHVFESNPGMYDTMRRYCAKCGIVEAAARKVEGMEDA